MGIKKIYRSNNNKVVAGVFGGIGEYFNVDPVILRLVWIFVWVFTAFIPGLVAYFLAVIIIPKKSN